MILIDQSLKKEYRIEESTTSLGRRSSNGIQIPDKDISSNHCKIISKENGYYIMDTSLNGTYFLIESHRGLYVKNKMEIDLESNHFLISKKENIIKFIPTGENGKTLELEVKINRIIYLEICENGLKRVKKRNNENNEKIIAFLTLEENKENENQMVLMKPQNTKLFLFFFNYFNVLQIMAKIAKRQRIPIGPKYTGSFGRTI